MIKVLLMFAFIANANTPEEFNCQAWAETHWGGCVSLAHHLVFDKHAIKKDKGPELLKFCDGERDWLITECEKDKK